MSGVASSPSLATCEVSQVLLAGVSGGFPGVLPFRPTYRLACLDMSEITLKGTLSEQCFHHVGMEPPLPGFYQFFLGGKCILLKDTTWRPE